MGALLMLGGYGLIFIGSLLVLIAAFKESVLWGLGSILIPFVGLFFIITHWEQSKGGVLFEVAGVACLVLGILTGGHTRAAENYDAKPPATLSIRSDRC
jgi:hypothetical protein